MDKNTLEQLLSTYNWWSGVSTIAVAVGILGEYVAHFIFEKEARENRLEMGLSILFGVLVLGGVVGEYQFGKRISQLAEQLQQIADAEVAAARRDAELARKQSADTNERAAQIEQHAAEENSRSAKALVAAENARKKAEGFNLQIAQANERAAEAERETARLKAALADRQLTDAQVKSIGNKLRPYSGQEWEVTTYRDNKESVGITERIYQSLQMAGWKFLPMTTWRGLMGGLVGIKVDVHPDADEPTQRAADALVAALQAEGLECRKEVQSPKNNPKHNTLSLGVGARR
ncbi:MAG: hypothetical protein WAM89_02225 [Terriglobales bacterium]